MPTLLKVRLSLKGRPIRSYTFNQKSISVGRDPGSDVFLDNTGISRTHARIELTPGGFMVEDMGSANGTYLNDQPVKRDYIGHNDVVQIGKFALWLGLDTDRREPALLSPDAAPGTLEGTTVLSAEQMMDLQRKSRDEEAQFERPPDSHNKVALSTCVTLSSASLGLGLILGAILATLLLP